MELLRKLPANRREPGHDRATFQQLDRGYQVLAAALGRGVQNGPQRPANSARVLVRFADLPDRYAELPGQGLSAEP